MLCLIHARPRPPGRKHYTLAIHTAATFRTPDHAHTSCFPHHLSLSSERLPRCSTSARRSLPPWELFTPMLVCRTTWTVVWPVQIENAGTNALGCCTHSQEFGKVSVGVRG